MAACITAVERGAVLFMFTRRRMLLAVSVLGLCVIAAYLLFSPDRLAFQTRLIAVDEARRSDRGVMETLRFTQQIDAIRTKYGDDSPSGPDGNSHDFKSEVRGVLNSKQDTQELIHYLRIYGTAMNANFVSNRRDESGAYAAVFFLILEKMRDALEKGNVDRGELTKIKAELNLEGMDSAEFDAILERKPFP